MGYLNDETADEIGAWYAMPDPPEEEPVTEADYHAQVRKAEVREAHCEHDWDEEAGGTQVNYHGMFEMLDVCFDCGTIRHTGKWTSVL